MYIYVDITIGIGIFQPLVLVNESSRVIKKRLLGDLVDIYQLQLQEYCTPPFHVLV